MAIFFFLIMPAPTESHSVFGHPWPGTRGFDDFYGHGRGHRTPAFNGYGFGDGYDDDYDNYFQQRAPCPRYQSMHLSDWQVAANQQLVLDISLPNVRHQDMRASLSSDGSTIHMKAWRHLPARGRACLPAGASVSHDGRYEVLEADIPVPGMVDGERASMRELRGGMRISVPHRPRPQEMSAPRRGWPQATATRDEGSSSGRSRTHANAHREAAATAALPGSRTQGPSEYARARVTVALPPSTGIQVEDDVFPWPQKNPDASEGWLDNRGDFQFY